MAFDQQRNLVAERTGSRYGKAAHAGDVYTIARGDSDERLPGDGGPAVGATFDSAGLAVVPQTGDLL